MRHLEKIIVLLISIQLAQFPDLHFGGWAIPNLKRTFFPPQKKRLGCININADIDSFLKNVYLVQNGK